MSRVLDKHMQQDRVFTTTQLSRNMALTPEGYLLCKNVGLARTGQMDYGPREVPDEMWSSAARDGRVTVERFPEDVFAPAFMDSLNGKPVVVKHPDTDVNPRNWKQHEVGIILNPRRGEGIDSDLIVGDVLIKDAEAIEYVRREKPEVSIGYEADYQEYEPGKWKQVPLIANHVALVSAGRCGSQCGIRDSGDDIMKTRDHATNFMQDAAWYSDWTVRLNNAIKVNDAKAIGAIMQEAQPQPPAAKAAGADDHVHIHLPGGAAVKDDGEGGDRLANLESRVGDHDGMHAAAGEKHAAFDADIAAIKSHLGLGGEGANDEEVEGNLKEEAPAGTSDALIKGAKDSALYADSFQAVRAAAEILSPGIQLPVYDAKLAPRKTVDTICQLRRKALDRANLTPEGRDVIEAVTGKALTLDGMPCATVRTLFNSVGAVIKARNSAGTRGSGVVKDAKDNTQNRPGRLLTAADINKSNSAFYGKVNA